MYNQKLIQLFYSSGLVSLPKAAEIASHFSQKLIAKNQFFLKEGNYCNEYLFLEKGFMRAFAYDTEGNDITTGFYSDNQVVFEVSSFFNRTISKENIQALADSEGWADQKAALVTCPLADDFRTQRVGAQQTVGTMLFGRADGDQDGFGFGQIGLDLGPSGKMELHAGVALMS